MLKQGDCFAPILAVSVMYRGFVATAPRNDHKTVSGVSRAQGQFEAGRPSTAQHNKDVGGEYGERNL
jgi:hypothetical protein